MVRNTLCTHVHRVLLMFEKVEKAARVAGEVVGVIVLRYLTRVLLGERVLWVLPVDLRGLRGLINIFDNKDARE